MASNFYDGFFYCSGGGHAKSHRLPTEYAVADKVGRIVCPYHGCIVRSKARLRGIKKENKDRGIIDWSMSNPHKVDFAGSNPAPYTNMN
jgi:hypothetical protein